MSEESPRDWKYFHSDKFTAIKTGLRDLTLLLNKEHLTEEYSFCSKEDFLKFKSFFLDFIVEPRFGEQEYIITEFSSDARYGKVALKYYQPGTRRCVYSNEINIGMLNGFTNEEVNIKLYNAKQELIKKAKYYDVDEFNDIKNLLEDVYAHIKTEENWK